MTKQTSVAKRVVTVLAAMALGLLTVGYGAGCGNASGDVTEQQDVVQEEQAEGLELTDGTYEIEAETDSSMFRAETCLLKVEGGSYTAVLSLPGEGFSRLYFGSADEAAGADESDIYDYELNDDGLYTFELPVESLDEELAIAAYGQRRDTWYDHTIIFHAPTGEPVADAG